MKKYEKPLYFIKRIKEEYEKVSNKNFLELIPEVMKFNEDLKKKQICILDLALFEILRDKLNSENEEEKQSLRLLKKYYYPSNIDIKRDIQTCSLDDILNIHNCLEYSQFDEYLLIHYNEIGVWTNPYVTGIERWDIYDAFLTECRSCIVNLKTMEFASLPFYKFRNLNESSNYQQEKIEERLKKAKIIEWSDKLDGSFIQMRYLDDERFWEETIISTSGNINSVRTNQLTDVLKYLKVNGENYSRLTHDYPNYTCIFEWIHGNDSHVVKYDKSQWGLHLIGMRNVEDGNLKPYKEIIEIAKKYNLFCTKLYSETLESVLAKLNTFKCSEKEGYVLNIDGFLVKVKCDDFVGMVRIIQETASFNTIIRYLVDGTIDDMLSRIPEEYQDRVITKVDKIYQYENTIKEIIKKYFETIPQNVSTKEAMIFIQKNIPQKFKNWVIAMYFDRELEILVKHKHTNCPSYIKEVDIDKMYSYLKDKKILE